jgi:hypothetical protein
LLHLGIVGVVRKEGRRPDDTEIGYAWNNFGKNLKPLADKAGALVRLSGYVAARMRKGANQAETDGIGGKREHDWYRLRGFSFRNSCG